MTRRVAVLTFLLTSGPLVARAQSRVGAIVPEERTRFSVQGVAGGAGGAHLELERAFRERLSLTLGVAAELRNPFGTNSRRLASMDLGIRRYVGPVQLRGLWLGGRMGYERQAPFAKDGPGTPSNIYLQGDVGYEKRLFDRLSLGASLGVQPRIGRLGSADRERYSAALRPRMGIGVSF